MVSEDVKKRILDAVLDKQVNFFWVWGFILLFSLFFVLSVGVWIGFKFNRAIHF
jgi:uncharacterized membrane protein